MYAMVISHDPVLLFIEQLLTVNNPRGELMQLFVHSENSPTVKSVSMMTCAVSYELLLCIT